MSIRHFWFILKEDIDRPIGGVKQIYRLASILVELGHQASIVQNTSDFRPSWFNSSDKLQAISFSDFSNRPLDSCFDIIVIPETFIAIFFRLPNVPIIIFNQNMNFLHGEKMNIKPEFVHTVYSSPRLAHVLSVSQSDFSYILNLLPVSSSKVSLLVNAIETDIFDFNFASSKSIAYMPRKNSDHVNIVLALLNQQDWFANSNWKLLPIINLPQIDVSKILRSSSIFLSFGYPEGFGLPLAEALSTGCYIVGYDGIGGREISQLGQILNVFQPIEFRDFHGFVMALKTAMELFDNASPTLHANLQSASDLISKRYCHDSMVKSVQAFLHKLNIS